MDTVPMDIGNVKEDEHHMEENCDVDHVGFTHQ